MQSGIYGVLEVWQSGARGDLTWDGILTGVNLRYIGKTLNRQKLFTIEELSPTGVLPVEVHYGLSLLAFLGMSAAPFFCPLFRSSRLRSRRRYRALGYGEGFLLGADVLGVILAEWFLLLLPAAVICRSLPAAVPGAAVMGCFCGLFACLCCLLTDSAAACSVLSLLTALAALIVSGGIVPPVLLPETLRSLGALSPITWLRTAGAWGMGADQGGNLLFCAIACLIMAGASFPLYKRKQKEGGEA